MSATHSHNHYYVPNPSPYPVLMGSGIFLLALGFILNMNSFGLGLWSMIAGAALIALVMYNWFGTVAGESEGGVYHKWEDRSFRMGMTWFIASEVAFFAAFFGALFYVRIISVPGLAGADQLWQGFVGTWPSAGPMGAEFTPMAAWGIPAINTALLLSSGATITWAHWGLLANNRAQLNMGMFLTIALGFLFIAFQAYEYHEAYTELGLTLGAGAYGATFFMLTGFHGFHVTMGAIMLTVILIRCLKGHFKPETHFGFEGVAWYWHFVDVVWLGLFIFVYWL
ncbi:MAG: cytochrome c oxidase subunit 3 [Gallionella sp.]